MRRASLNHTYRLVWSDIANAFVAVSETTKTNGKKSRAGCAIAASLGFLLAASPLHAAELPTGGQIVGGAGSISQSGNVMTVHQTTANMAADWQSFSIGVGHTVNFVQPSASSVALNRVLGSDVSVIQGALNANGQVFLINPNGVLFSPSAQVNVGGIVASTLSMSTSDFMAGNYKFSGASSSAIINQGNITATNGGTIALIAAKVSNEGILTASQGNILLAAGSQVTLDMGGPVKLQVTQGAIDALIQQGGAIKADGGLVYLTAKAAGDLASAVINHTGMLEASSLTTKGGSVILEADDITLASGSVIAANGADSGGTVLVGGNWQGSGSLHQATDVTMEAGARISADAMRLGDGGTVVLWSDIHNVNSTTRAYGEISANGGIESGNGGHIETSGHWLDVNGVSGSAAARSLVGQSGEWLFDPYNVTITSATANNSESSGSWTPSADNSTIDVASINALLNGGTSVTVTTGSSGSQIGDITVASAITKSSGASDVSLTLRAANSVVVDQAISHGGGTGKLNVTLDADNDNGTRNGGGIVILNNNISTGGGNLNFGTGDTLNINGVTTKVGGDLYVAGSGVRSINTNGGHVNVNGEMIIANTSGLSISTNNGNVILGGLINSGNQYTFVDKTGSSGTGSWDDARTEASGVADSYLVTITSRLENSLAMRSTNYVGAWIGAYRPDQTSGAWTWADGPESGQTFFNQNSGGGGSTVSGFYSNFDSVEPNGSFVSSPTVTETRGQFFGTQGLWNDLSNATTYSAGGQYSVYGFVRETNLAASPLTVNAGSGTVTFGGAVGVSKALSSLNVTAGTVAINGGAVTTLGLQTYNGNVTLGAASTTLSQTNADTDFTLQAGKSITNATNANASLLIKTTRDVHMASGSAISSGTGALAVTLNSDSDATDGGGIWLQTDGGTAAGATISSNGGNITLSGGTDVTTGYAQGRNVVNGNGITLDEATLNSAGGNILLRGKGTSGSATAIASKDAASSVNTDGIRLHGSNTINAGAGTVISYGVAEGLGASNGIELSQTGTTTIQSSNATANAILLNGSSTSNSVSTTNGFGVYTWGNSSILATNGGGITLSGTGTKNAGVVVASNGNVLANSGKITISGTGAGTGGNSGVVVAGTVGQKASTAVTSSTSAIDIVADTVNITGTLQSSGALTIKPTSTSTSIGIAGAAGTLALTAANFSTNFVNGFSGITVGRNDGTGKITTGAFVVNDDLTLLNTTGGVELTGVLNAGNNTLTLSSSGTVTDTGTGAVVAGGLALLGTGGSYTLNSTSNNITTLAANTGSVSFYESDGLTISSVGATNGINATAGSILVETGTGDINITQNLTASNTGLSAIIVNASKTAAAGTVSGGNIVLSGTRTFTTGSGGRAILYSGSPSDSTGLTSLVNNASGTLTYSADEATTPTPNNGIHAIYRGLNPVAPVTSDPNSSPAQQSAISNSQNTASQSTNVITNQTNASGQVELQSSNGLELVSLTQSGDDQLPENLGNDGQNGLMKVFVVNGGIHLPKLPYSLIEDENRQELN